MSDFRTQFDEYYDKALQLFRLNGSTTEVHEYIQAIDDEDYRERTFEKMAQFLAEQGSLDDAFRYCEAIARPLPRADALFAVGQVLKLKGDVDAAAGVFSRTITTASKIECPYDEAAVLLQVADQLESRDEALNLVYQAVTLARPLPQDFEASKTLRGCARILAKWNRLSEATQIAETIDSRWSALRDTTLEEIRGGGEWPVRAEDDR